MNVHRLHFARAQKNPSKVWVLFNSRRVIVLKFRERTYVKNDLIKLLRKRKDTIRGETIRFGSVQKIILTVKEPLIFVQGLYVNWESPLGKSSRGYNGTLWEDVRLLEELVSLWGSVNCHLLTTDWMPPVRSVLESWHDAFEWNIAEKVIVWSWIEKF